MSDGLTESEANAWAELIEVMRTEPYNMPARLEARRRFIWAIRAPIEARAEAAEARVAELERAVIWMSGSAEFGPGQPAHDHWVEIRDTLLFAPTTEAVTE